MTLPSQLQDLPEVRGALTVDSEGRLVSAEPGTPHADADGAAAFALALNGIAKAGEAAGLGPFVLAHLKGAHSALVAGSRPDALLLVHLDPSHMSSPAEKAVRAWSRGEAATPRQRHPTPPAPVNAAPPPLPSPAHPTPTGAGFAAPGAGPPERAAKPAAPGDAFSRLRHALGRGQLTEAAALRWELKGAGDASRPGCEPVPPEGCERAIQSLLEGVGSVMAGDGLGGARALAELADDDEPNLSFRWLALHFSARAALRSGSVPTARAKVQAALTLARQLDIEARALSQWTAAEILAHDNDSTRALAWLAEARSRFERISDRWGIGQTWLAEARLHASLERGGPAAEAARHAAEMLPESDEPHALLAKLALLADDLTGAETLVSDVKTPAGEKIRVLIAAIREGRVSKADAADYLREHDAAPSQRSLRALTRVAASSPKFLPAREALAWMHLRTGRYDEAGAMFRALLSQPLSAGERASVMLGLGCVANAGKASAPTRSVIAAVPPPSLSVAGEVPLPSASAVGSARPGGNGGDAVFSGRLSSFTLPDLLEFLRSGRRTGLLVCSCEAGMGALRFREGQIVGAASPGTPGLAEALSESRGVSLAAIGALKGANGAELPDDALAERIVERGLADEGTVLEALSQLVWTAVRELVGWRDGEFAFNRDNGADSSRLAVAVDPQEVLLDVFREMDEASRGSPSAKAGPASL